MEITGRIACQENLYRTFTENISVNCEKLRRVRVKMYDNYMYFLLKALSINLLSFTGNIENWINV